MEFTGEEVRKVVTERNEYETDLVILAVGFNPAVDLAKRIGLKLDVTGTIETKETM